MVSFHDQFQNYYSGLNQALNFMNGEIGDFGKAFYPSFKPVTNTKVLLDVLKLGFAIVTAGAFNSCQ